LSTSLHYASCHYRDLHSLPTRRSSDLKTGMANCAVVFIIRTIPPNRTLGSSFIIVIPLPISFIFSADDPLFEGSLSLLITKTIKDRKSTRLNSSHVSISYAVFCLKKKN